MKQSELATLLGVHRGSIQLWERGVGEQGVKCLAAIIRFLGYVPFDCGGTSGEKLSFLRRCCGKTQEELAAETGCDPSSITRWEAGKTENAKKLGPVLTHIWKELRILEIQEMVRSALKDR